MRLVAPFGFYGWGNIGDEATLKGFARLLGHYDASATAWFGSRDPRHTRRTEPAFRYFPASGRSARRWWAHQRAEGAVFVGGTPIMDVLGRWPLSEVIPLVAAQAGRGRPIAFVGVGTERLNREESRGLIARELAPRVQHWSVRSEFDRDRLLEYGVPAERLTVAADLAWALEPSAPAARVPVPSCLLAGSDELLVAVNVNNEKFVADQAPHLFGTLAQLLDHLVDKRRARVVFFCNEIREGASFDKAASQLVIGLMRHSDHATILPNEYRTPHQMMALLKRCHLAIGMRYHFCVFAAIEGVPFLAIKRSDKVTDLCRDLSWRHGVGLDEMDASHLEALAADLLDDRPRACATLRERISAMRERVWRNEQALDRLRDPGPR